MPTRYLKPGICDSSSIDSVSPEAERLYYRLLVNVDDFGRMDARLPIIKARCFPLKEEMKSSVIEKWLKELAESGLTLVYICMDEPFLQFTKWDNKPRASESKFPAFDDTCIQMYTDVPLTETVTVTKTVTETPDVQAVVSIFDFWKETFNHPKSLLDDNRKRRIKAALKMGYTVDDLKEAITGCSLTPHNMGDNDRGQRYDGLNVILKDADNIDRFIANAGSPPKSKPKPSGNDPFDKLCSQLGVVPYDQYPEWDDPLISKALFKAGSWMEFSRMLEKKQKYEFRPKFLEAYKSLGG